MKEFSWLNQLRNERISQNARNPGLAALMSFFVMGLGQIYAGHIDRGIVLLVIQLAAIGSGYNLYNKGFLFETLTSVFAPTVLVVLFYVASVALILLWIFNIKDAYYLSLFSSFRDWFEIERTIVPLMYHYKTPLLTHQTVLEANSPVLEVKRVSDVPLDIEIGRESSDLENKSVDAKHSKKVNHVKRKKSENLNKPQLAEFIKPETSFNLKFYGAIAAVFFICGTFISSKLSIWSPQTNNSETIEFQRDFNFRVMAKNKGNNASDTIVTNTPSAMYQNTSSDSSTELGKLKIESSSGDNLTNNQVTSSQTISSTITPSPLTPDEEIILGMDLISKGYLASGAEKIEAGLSNNRDAQPHVWRSLIFAYRELGDNEKYEATLKRYLSNYNIDAEGWIALGKLYLDNKNYVEASRAFSRALELIPKHPRANFFMGTLYRELGMPEDAIPYFQKALESDPINPEFLRELGAAYLDIKDLKQAKRHLEKAISVSPSDEAARGLLTQVETMYEESDLIVPNQAQTAQIQLKDNTKTSVPMELLVPDKNFEIVREKTNAERLSYGKVLFKAPDFNPHEHTQSNIPEVLKITNFSQKSTKFVGSSKEAVILEPVSSATVKIENKKVISKNEKVVPVIDDSLKNSVAVEEVASEQQHLNTSNVNLSVPKKENTNLLASSAAFEKVVEDFQSLFDKAREKFYAQKWDEALPLFLQILKSKEDPLVYEFVADTFEKLDMSQDAFDAMHRAYELGKKDFKTIVKLGQLADKCGKNNEAKNYFEAAIKENPKRVDLHFALVKCLIKMGKVQEAKQYLEKILVDFESQKTIKSRILAEIEKIKDIESDFLKAVTKGESAK